MSRSNCPVRVYNKDISKKYRVDFFILADAKYYFIYNIGVCQGNNTENIDIHPSLQNLPTTHKYVSKDIIKRGVSNDLNRSRHIYMENLYYAPQLFALMDSTII